MDEERYDVCVIGAGSAGFAAAEAARAAGLRLILIGGPEALGGTCIMRGCMPAKTLLSASERVGAIERAGVVGVQAGPARVDVPALIARKRELVDYFRADRLAELADYPLLRGAARFVAHDAVDVGGRRITARKFVLATGSRVVAPPIPGLAESGYLLSDDVLELTAIPASLVVIGGGPVGCEFAQYFARLGSRVTLLEDGPHLLRNEDADVGAAVAAALRAEGVEVVLDARIARCTPAAGGACSVAYRVSANATSITCERLLLATGRVPNLAGLDVVAAGIVAADDALAVDPYLRTTNPSVFVAGDALGWRCLVHLATYTGRLAIENAFGARLRPADFDRFEAHAVYTQPQVAVAGLTERTCRERGLAVHVRRHPFSDVGKALVSDEATGFVKMIADGGGRVLGVAIVGDAAIDLIGEAIAVIDRGATVSEVAEMPHLHPTMGEILGRVAEDILAARDPVRAA